MRAYCTAARALRSQAPRRVNTAAIGEPLHRAAAIAELGVSVAAWKRGKPARLRVYTTVDHRFCRRADRNGRDLGDRHHPCDVRTNALACA